MYRWKYITEKDGKASEYKAYEEEAISNVDDYVDVEYVEDYQLDAEDLVDLQKDEYAVKTTLWLLLQRLQKESSLF